MEPKNTKDNPICNRPVSECPNREMFYQQGYQDHIRDLESALIRARRAEASWKDELDRHLKIEEFHDHVMEESLELRMAMVRHRQEKYGDGDVTDEYDAELYTVLTGIIVPVKPQE